MDMRDIHRYKEESREQEHLIRWNSILWFWVMWHTTRTLIGDLSSMKYKLTNINDVNDVSVYYPLTNNILSKK
jgi:hypothetical protein